MGYYGDIMSSACTKARIFADILYICRLFWFSKFENIHSLLKPDNKAVDLHVDVSGCLHDYQHISPDVYPIAVWVASCYVSISREYTTCALLIFFSQLNTYIVVN
jgi:hypothetical protein